MTECGFIVHLDKKKLVKMNNSAILSGKKKWNHLFESIIKAKRLRICRIFWWTNYLWTIQEFCLSLNCQFIIVETNQNKQRTNILAHFLLSMALALAQAFICILCIQISFLSVINILEAKSMPKASSPQLY